jgi:hypothetical protein
LAGTFLGAIGIAGTKSTFGGLAEPGLKMKGGKKKKEHLK